MSRPRPPRDPHRVPRLHTYTHSRRTHSPLLSTPLPTLPLAFVRHRAVQMVDFLACNKARLQPQPAPPPARPARAPLACPWHRHACPSCCARRHRRCGRPRRAHAVVCACARRQVFARPGGPRRTRCTTPDDPTTPQLPCGGSACIILLSSPSPTPHILSHTHFHPHNLLLPGAGGNPHAISHIHPPQPTPPAALRVAVHVLACLSYI